MSAWSLPILRFDAGPVRKCFWPSILFLLPNKVKKSLSIQIIAEVAEFNTSAESWRYFNRLGTFTKQDNAYQGTISTLSVNAKATITPVEKTGEQSPDFRVFASKAEIGAAWKATSKAGNPYISVKLDDPSFPAPIFGRLVESDKGHSLIWNR